ncbi:MAG: hypothetical protein JAZ17_19960 [Candidatus Thiodiazotropha endolucinida]|nr:hypothetical protein [Candidatus Thiodiazotropha endolucinida]
MNTGCIVSVLIVVAGMLAGCQTKPSNKGRVLNHDRAPQNLVSKPANELSHLKSIDDLVNELTKELNQDQISIQDNGRTIIIRYPAKPSDVRILEGRILNRICEYQLGDKQLQRMSDIRLQTSYYLKYGGPNNPMVSFNEPIEVVKERIQKKAPYAIISVLNESNGFLCVKYEAKDTRTSNELFMVPLFSGRTFGEFKRGQNSTSMAHMIILKQDLLQPVVDRAYQKYVNNAPSREHQAKRYAEQHRKKSEESRKQVAKREANEKRKREKAKYMLSNRDAIGERICKDGTLNYTSSSGIYFKGELVTNKRSTRGQIIAFLEGYSDNGYRIKFRVANWATPNGKIPGKLVGIPSMDGLAITSGTVYWDDVKDWHPCVLR